MKKTQDSFNKTKQNQSPMGTGSDKQHPETPYNANQRFEKQKKKENNIQDNPGKQSTG